MEAYGKFAQVYDLFMDNIDYESWASSHAEKHLQPGELRRTGSGTGLRCEHHDGLLAQRI